MAARRPFRRTRSGDFKVSLGTAEREILGTLPAQVRAVLDDPGDPAMRRLFPAAVPDDAVGEAEYTMRTHGTLVEGRLDAIATLERTVDASRLTEAELLAWLRTLNDLRLVLGVRLDVRQEDDLDVGADDTRRPMIALYGFLTWLVDAAVGELPTS